MSDNFKSLKTILKPSVLDIVFITILVFILFVDSGGHILKDADTGFHIMTGNYILNNLEFPSKDVFSHTCPGQQWIAFSWGTGFLFAIIERIAGINGVVILSTLVILATILIVYKYLLLHRVNFFILSVAIVSLTSLMSIHWLARPHLFTIFFTALSFYLLELARTNKKIYFFFPILMLIWANIHPGFIAGFFMLGAFFLGSLIESIFSDTAKKNIYLENAKYLFFVILISLLVSLINPYGVQLIVYIYKTLTSYWIVNATNEYKSPNFQGTLAVIVYMIVIVTFIITGLLQKKRVLDFSKIIILLLWLHLSLFAIRNIAVFAVIAIPCLALMLDDASKKLFSNGLKDLSDKFLEIELSCKYHFWPAVLILVSLMLAINNGYLFDNKILNCYFSPEKIPVNAMKYIESHPIKGNLFNEDNWGGFIIYAYPDIKVFMDGRLDMYQQNFLDQYQTISRGSPGWVELMKKYNVGWVLIRNKTVLHNILENRSDWNKVYHDKLSSIFVKSYVSDKPKLH